MKRIFLALAVTLALCLPALADQNTLVTSTPGGYDAALSAAPIGPPSSCACKPTGGAGSAESVKYGYRVTTVTAGGESVPSPEVTCRNAPVLDSTHYNSVTCFDPPALVPNYAGYHLYGRTPGAGGYLSVAGGFPLVDNSMSAPGATYPSTDASGSFKSSGGGSSPTFALTAAENIATNTAVSVNASGQAVAHWGPAPNIAGAVTLFGGASTGTRSAQAIASLPLSGGAKFVTFSSAGAQAGAISGTTIALGALDSSSDPSLHAISIGYGPQTGFIEGAALSASTFVVVYNDPGSGFPNAVIGTVSGGNAISYGSPVQLFGVGTHSAAGAGVIALSSTSFLCALQLTDSSQQMIAATVSGTTITAGTPITITNNDDDGYTAIAQLSSTLFAVAYNDGNAGGDPITAVAVTLAAPRTLTAHTPLTIGDTGGSFYLNKLSSSSFVLDYTAADSNRKAIAGSVDGSNNITYGSPVVAGPAGGVAWSTPFGTGIAIQGVAYIAPQVISASGTALTVSAATGIERGSLPLSQAYPGVFGPIAAMSSSVLMFADTFFSIFEMNASGVLSPPLQHQFLTNYWLYPIDATHALAVLCDNSGTAFARAIAIGSSFNATPPVGITAAGAASSASVTIQNAGKLTGLSGLTPGATYYSSGDGLLTTADTGHPMGTALSATEMAVAPR